MSYETQLASVAMAEDVYDLQQHIGWTDVIKPRLQLRMEAYSKMLVGHLLGGKLPENLTKEQLAGKIYGIQEIISTFEAVLTHGKKALEDIQSSGVSLQL